MRIRKEMARQLREAAARAQRDDFCKYTCWIVSDIVGDAKTYVSIFKPTSVARQSAFWVDDAMPRATRKQLLEWRITALCLYAAMLEAGDA